MLIRGRSGSPFAPGDKICGGARRLKASALSIISGNKEAICPSGPMPSKTTSKGIIWSTCISESERNRAFAALSISKFCLTSRILLCGLSAATSRSSARVMVTAAQFISACARPANTPKGLVPPHTTRLALPFRAIASPSWRAMALAIVWQFGSVELSIILLFNYGLAIPYP